MKNSKYMLIINPVSGRGVMQRKIWNILNIFSKAGIAPTVLLTQKRGDAKKIAAACTDEYETVVCAGGDGTLNEVISGLMENPFPHKLGYIPVGTTNDLANSLGLSKMAEKSVTDIIEGTSTTIDVGCFNGRYFNYIASFGAFTEASYNAPQEAKNVLGHAAYLLEGLMSIGNVRPYKVTFNFDGKEVNGSFIFGAICNTTSVAGILKLKETMVALNDGKFEILLIKEPRNLQQFSVIMSDLLSQNFKGNYVKLYHASEITVTTDEEIDWTLDGEKQEGSNRLEIRNINKAINFIVPNKKAAEK